MKEVVKSHALVVRVVDLGHVATIAAQAAMLGNDLYSIHAPAFRTH